ncbi:MAG: alanine--tRNA ligase, partial [Flavobacteriales bacterium]
ITGDAVRQAFLESRDQWLQLRQLTNSNQPIQSVEQLQSDLHKANEKLKEFERNHNRQLAEVLRGKIVTHGAFSVLIEKTELDSSAVKDFAFALKNQHPNLFMVLAGEQDGKAILSIAAGDEAVNQGHHAGNLVREWSKLIRGGGGGQAFFATAGGGYPQGIKEVLEKAKAYIGLI